MKNELTKSSREGEAVAGHGHLREGARHAHHCQTSVLELRQLVLLRLLGGLRVKKRVKHQVGVEVRYSGVEMKQETRRTHTQNKNSRAEKKLLISPLVSVAAGSTLNGRKARSKPQQQQQCRDGTDLEHL